MEFGSVKSKPLLVGELRELYGNTIPEDVFLLDENKAAYMLAEEFRTWTTDPATFNQIQEDCSLENLFFDGECNTLEEILKVLPAAKSGERSLKTVERLRPLLNKTTCRKQLLCLLGRVPKPFVDLSFRNSVEESSEATKLLRDTFVTVCVYRPSATRTLDMLNRPHKMVMTQRIVLLASQNLSCLRDAIKCPQDKVWLGDCSLALDNEELHIAADKLYKSSYFFIEGVFYDDLRDEARQSLSKPVVEWMNSKKEFDHYKPAKSVPMESVTLENIVICVGKPYIFLHQGNCEHVIFFSDIRLVDREACQLRSAFPMVTGRLQFRPLRCFACKQLNTYWLVSNAKTLLPVNPCPLCDVCLRMLLYDSSGNKIFPGFTVHKYYGDEITF